MPEENRKYNDIVRQLLRLNCLTPAYGELWKLITGSEWTPDTPILYALDCQQVQVRIDVSVARMLNISEKEPGTIYRAQFPVMCKYHLVGKFDENGRRVPKEILDMNETNLSQKETPVLIHPQSGREH